MKNWTLYALAALAPLALSACQSVRKHYDASASLPRPYGDDDRGFKFEIVQLPHVPVTLGQGYNASTQTPVTGRDCAIGEVENGDAAIAESSATSWMHHSPDTKITLKAHPGAQGTLAPIRDAATGDSRVWSTVKTGQMISSYAALPREAARQPSSTDCGDSYVSSVYMSVAFGYVFRVEFADQAAADAFVSHGFNTNQETFMNGGPHEATVRSDLLRGRAQLRVVAFQAGGDTSEVKTLLEGTQCTTADLSACDALNTALSDYMKRYLETSNASRKDATPSDPHGWAPLIFETNAYGG